MLQKTLITEDTKKLISYIRKLKSEEAFKKAGNVLVLMFEPYPEQEILNRKLEMIRSELPGASVAGLTTSRHSLKAGEGIYSFLLFENSGAEVFCYDCREVTPVEAGKSLRREIRYRDDVAGIMVFSAGVVLELDDFLDTVSEEKVPIVGTEAGTGVNFSSRTGRGVRPCILSDRALSYAILAIVFYGPGLKMYVSYDMGWKPIGKEMTVTATDGKYGMSRIDNAPASEIYARYLGVRPDSSFVDNVKEFPIVTKRGEKQVVRCPAGCDKNGNLYFMAQVRAGDKIQLSYASPRRMISELKGCVNEMKGFAPQALFLMICENRAGFLGELSGMDVRLFKARWEELSWIRGFAEIIRDERGGGVVNSALLAVGLREGEAAEEDTRISPEKEEEDDRGAIPLNERMATFLEETSKELGEMAVAAQAANQAKSSFLSNMSHEIRTPINAILGMNEMILRESTNPAVLAYAHDVKNAGFSLLGLINDILDLSKIEADKLVILPVDYESAYLFGDIMNMIRKRAEDKGLKLKLEMNTSLPRVLHGDEIRIRQIITNILTNAVKYTEYGFVTLKVDFEKKGDASILLKVAISDTGIGIKEEDIGKLFSAFDRIEEVRNRAVEGTGLGMNITGKLLNMMGSELHVESIYGEGSTFSFELSQEVSDWDEIGVLEGAGSTRAGEVNYRERFRAPDARILVVDDTPMNLTVIINLLKQTRIKIDTASSGEECLEFFNARDYDLILLDHRMSDMDGVETLKRIRETPKKGSKSIPVICLTANAVSGAREEYMKAGFTDYVSKPIDTNHLEGTLIRHLPKSKVIITESEAVTEKEEQEEESLRALPQWLKGVHALDLKNALENCGSAEGLKEALKIFFSSAEERAAELERYVENGSWQDFTIKVHALKSMARTVGAGDLSSAAAALEEAGDSGNIEYIRKHTPGFLKDYRELKEALGPLKDSADEKPGEAGELPMITGAELSDALLALKEIALSFDYESMVMIMDSLNGYSFPEQERERMEELRSAVGIPDWDRIKKVLS